MYDMGNHRKRFYVANVRFFATRFAQEECWYATSLLRHDCYLCRKKCGVC
jgi:hypothetical protein